MSFHTVLYAVHGIFMLKCGYSVYYIASNYQRLVKCVQLVFSRQGWLCIVLLDQLAHQCISSLETWLGIVYLTTYLSHGR